MGDSILPTILNEYSVVWLESKEAVWSAAWSGSWLLTMKMTFMSRTQDIVNKYAQDLKVGRIIILL